MTRDLTRTAVLLCATTLALAGCENFPFAGDQQKPATETTVTSQDGATTLVERDVEMPEVFSATEEGLWDGRPSLGGVWVAHPDVKDPERVIIRNQEKNTFVIGALFRRERDHPGPRLMISSDAAAALGIIAGKPTQLNVTALGKEEVKPAPAPAPAAADDGADADAAPVAETATPDTISEEPLKSLDAVTAAIEEAEAGEAATAKPKPAAAAAAPSSLSQPFIQIGFFSVEANAKDTADKLRKDGILPSVKQQSSSGKTYWRVVVGPANNKSERDALMKKVTALGFGDAYFVKD